MEESRTRRPRLLAPMVLGALMACTPNATESTSTTPPATSPATTTQPPVDRPPPCLAGAQRFSQEGGAGTSIRTGTDAQVVGSIRWTQYAGCERLTIELVTSDAAPAVDPPSVSGFFFRESALLRVSLGQEIISSLATDQLIDTDLVQRAFVVTAPDGGIFVDLHLAAPVFARVSAGSSPARAVVDLQPGGPVYQSRAVVASSTVVVDPATRMVRYPFSAAGYTVGGAGVTGRLAGADREVEVSTPVSPRNGTWGGFVLLFPDGPLGDLTFTIGDEISMPLTAE